LNLKAVTEGFILSSSSICEGLPDRWQELCGETEDDGCKENTGSSVSTTTGFHGTIWWQNFTGNI